METHIYARKDISSPMVIEGPGPPSHPSSGQGDWPIGGDLWEAGDQRQRQLKQRPIARNQQVSRQETEGAGKGGEMKGREPVSPLLCHRSGRAHTSGEESNRSTEPFY